MGFKATIPRGERVLSGRGLAAAYPQPSAHPDSRLRRPAGKTRRSGCSPRAAPGALEKALSGPGCCGPGGPAPQPGVHRGPHTAETLLMTVGPRKGPRLPEVPYLGSPMPQGSWTEVSTPPRARREREAAGFPREAVPTGRWRARPRAGMLGSEDAGPTAGNPIHTVQARDLQYHLVLVLYRSLDLHSEVTDF